MKCATCDVKLNEELDVVYGLYPGPAPGEEEITFCCRFCRDVWLSDHRRV